MIKTGNEYKLCLLGLTPFFRESEGKIIYKQATVIINEFTKNIYFHVGQDIFTPKNKVKDAMMEVTKTLNSRGVEVASPLTVVEKLSCWDIYYRDMPRGRAKFIKASIKPSDGVSKLINFKGKTFYNTIGHTMSFEEAFMLENGIKGPTWIKLKNFLREIELSKPQQSISETFLCKDSSYFTVIPNVTPANQRIDHALPSLSVMSITLKYDKKEKQISEINCHLSPNYNLDGSLLEGQYNERVNVGKTMIFTCESTSRVDHVLGSREVDTYHNPTRPLKYFIRWFVEISPDVLCFGFDSDVERLYNELRDERNALVETLLENKDNEEATLKYKGMLDRFEALMSKFPRVKIASNQQFWLTNKDPLLLFDGRIVVALYSYTNNVLRKKKYHDVDSMLCDTPLVKNNTLASLLVDNNMNRNNSPHCLTYLMDHHRCLQYTLRLANRSGVRWSRPSSTNISHYAQWLLTWSFYKENCIIPDTTVDHSSMAKDFEGGKYLEPSIGLYMDHLILLDVGSAYPFSFVDLNLCFTTIDNKGNKCESLTGKKQGILPSLMQMLVSERAAIKRDIAELRKHPTALGRIENLIDEESATKLAANSIYGCLGQKIFLYYNPQIASRITAHVRGALQCAASISSNYVTRSQYCPTNFDSKRSVAVANYLSKGNSAQWLEKMKLIDCQSYSRNPVIQAGMVDSIIVNTMYRDESLNSVLPVRINETFSISYTGTDPKFCVDPDSYTSLALKLEKIYSFTSVIATSWFVGLYIKNVPSSDEKEFLVDMKGIPCIRFEQPSIIKNVVEKMFIKMFLLCNQFANSVPCTLSGSNTHVDVESFSDEAIKFILEEMKTFSLEMKTYIEEYEYMDEFVALYKFKEKSSPKIYKEFKAMEVDSDEQKEFVIKKGNEWLMSCKYLKTKGIKIKDGMKIPYVRIMERESSKYMYVHPEDYLDEVVNNPDIPEEEKQNYGLDYDWYIQHFLVPNINYVFGTFKKMFQNVKPAVAFGLSKGEDASTAQQKQTEKENPYQFLTQEEITEAETQKLKLLSSKLTDESLRAIYQFNETYMRGIDLITDNGGMMELFLDALRIR